MVIRICCIIILLSVTGSCLTGQHINSYSVRNFKKQEYNAENQNWSIAVDHKGFIYVANNVGLLEFDGVDWQFFPAPNGTVIRSVQVDQRNRIYTGGYREIGFWERDLEGQLIYHSLNPKAESLFSPNEEFWNTVVIGNRVYFHSFSSVFIYDHDQFRVIRDTALINSISNLNGTLCLHLSRKGLYALKDGLVVPFLVNPEMANDNVQFCIPLKDSSILIGTVSSGLYLYRDHVLIPYLEQWTGYFAEQKVNRGAISGEGHIIIGTLLDGIMVYDQSGNLLHHINTQNGLQNNTVLGILCDRDNSIWLSLDKGVDYVNFNADPSYTFHECRDVGALYSASLFGEELYLCTNQGVFYRPWRDDGSDFRIIPGTQDQAWSCGIFDDQLIVSHNRGTFRIRGHAAERISPVTGGFSAIINPMNSNGLVQSTYSNIVFYENRDHHWRYHHQLPDFNDLIRYIEMDHLNNIWASHMHRGVYKLKLNDRQDSIQEREYAGESVFGKNFGIQVFKIENRIIFTSGEKIYTYSDLQDSIIPYRLLNEELGKFRESHRVVVGYDHYYWFISHDGIGLFRILHSGVEKIKEYPAGIFGGHLIDNYENIIPISSVEGLLCLDNGYAVLHAGQSDHSRLIEDKQLSLKSIQIMGRSGDSQYLPVNQISYRIPFHRNSVTLSYAFPLFSSESIKFQYRIEGLDNGWSDPVSSPLFSLTRIPSGSYRIHVRALNEWEKQSKESQLFMQVARPWFLNNYSFVIYISIIIIGFLSGRYILIQRIRNREKRIREAKEKELIRLRNEKLNAELSHKSQELANLTIASIKKNEFLLELKEAIRNQKEELGTRYPDKYYNALAKKIDNHISSLDEWKVFEIHFERAHEKFLQKIVQLYPALSHSDLRLCAYLRMNLTSKEIAPLLRISYRGVENHRYKLRKKFNLKKEENLTDFILSI